MSENNIINSNADVQEAPPVSEETTATQNPPVEEKAPVAAPTAHDDFDWSIDKRNVSSYTKEERLKYDDVYDNTFVAITDGELVKGLVVALTKTDVVINIGFKSDGLVSLNICTLAASMPALPVHGKKLWKFIKPVKLLPVPLQAKQRVV